MGAKVGDNKMQCLPQNHKTKWCSAYNNMKIDYFLVIILKKCLGSVYVSLHTNYDAFCGSLSRGFARLAFPPVFHAFKIFIVFI